MASNLQMEERNLTRRLARRLEDYASDLFGVFGEHPAAIEEAQHLLDKAERFDELRPVGQLLRARILATVGKHTRALAVLEKLRTQRPDDAQVLAEIASIYEETDADPKQIDRAYAQAIENLSASDPTAQYTVLGYLGFLGGAGQIEKAKKVGNEWSKRLGRTRRPRRALNGWLERFRGRS